MDWRDARADAHESVKYLGSVFSVVIQMSHEIYSASKNIGLQRLAPGSLPIDCSGASTTHTRRMVRSPTIGGCCARWCAKNGPRIPKRAGKCSRRDPDRYPRAGRMNVTGNPVVYVTENGAASIRRPDGDRSQDPLRRRSSVRNHVKSLLAAMEVCVDLRGYFVWVTLLDNPRMGALAVPSASGIVHVTCDAKAHAREG